MCIRDSSCTDDLMERLAAVQKQYHLPLQSHLSENMGEIAWVKELCPNTRFYGEAYDQFGLFGGEGCPTVMAHCVYSGEEEMCIRDRVILILFCDFRISRHTVCQKKNGIVCRSVSVYGNHIVGVLYVLS